jgi:hypothetical protein
VPDDLEKKIEELKAEFKKRETRIKKELLAGATIEHGAHYAELRLLPGRNPNSKNPDDYELVISFVC